MAPSRNRHKTDGNSKAVCEHIALDLSKLVFNE